MARTLNAAVFVDGNLFRPGDHVPEEFASRIGDHAWTEDEVVPARIGTAGVGDPVPPPVDVFPAAPEQTAPESPDDEPEQTPTPATEADSHELPVPPRSGKGSGLDAWRTYARSIGVELHEGDDRDDVIAAVDAHKLAQKAQQ